MNTTLLTRNAVETERYIWLDKTILVVEDIDLNYRYLKELLEPTGAMILRAENGQDAVNLCMDNAEIDAILMDIFMPVMNGYEATRKIKAWNPSIPIIAQTAYVMSEDRKKALAAGCDDYIAKPIGKEELLSKIEHLFTLYKQ